MKQARRVGHEWQRRQRVTPDEIVTRLTKRTANRIPAYQAIEHTARTRALVAVLESETSDDVKGMVAYMLGDRRDRKAIPALLSLLGHPNPSVRSTAADALGKLGGLTLGPPLLAALEREPDGPTRQMLTSALGATGFRPATPALVVGLSSGDEKERAMAAWSLGEFRAWDTLTEALKREEVEWVRGHIEKALDRRRAFVASTEVL
jgi:HEAT repeat protein